MKECECNHDVVHLPITGCAFELAAPTEPAQGSASMSRVLCPCRLPKVLFARLSAELVNTSAKL